MNCTNCKGDRELAVPGLQGRSYCLGCRCEIMTESGHLCERCRQQAEPTLQDSLDEMDRCFASIDETLDALDRSLREQAVILAETTAGTRMRKRTVPRRGY